MKPKTSVRFCVTLSFWLLGLGLFLPGRQLLAQTRMSAAPAQLASAAFSYKIIPGTSGGFGYDIYFNNRLKIHQPHIPALPGNEGFRSQAAAKKIALLVIAKLQKGETLPTVSLEEMQKLNAVSRSYPDNHFKN